MEYKLGGLHPQDLASGRLLEPGETVELTDEEARDPHNKALIDSGVLFDLGEFSEPAATDAALVAADDLDVNIAAVTGTGVDGRITKDDVERYHAEQTAEGGEAV